MLLAERQLTRITDIQFYDNVVDTRTPGLDVVATHDRDSLSGELTLTGALHFNETEITAGRDNFTQYRQSYIEERNPRQRHRLAAGAADETFDLHLGVNYFGKAVRQKVNPGRGRVPGPVTRGLIETGNPREPSTCRGRGTTVGHYCGNRRCHVH